MQKHIAILLTAAVPSAGVTVSTTIHADDLTPVWQYELGFHGRHIESNIYLSYQAGSGGYAAADVDDSALIRLPLYSSNPNKDSVARQWSLLMNDSDDESPSFGKTVGMMFVGLLYVAPTVYAVAHRLDELNNSWNLCSRGCVSSEKSQTK
jgi:hypothetical protein